jgi:cation transport regulator ChaC
MTDFANEFAEQFTEDYFAYGSNMDVNQMSHRCPNAVLKGVGVLKDYCFDLDSKGYATIRPLPGSSVQGIIWKVFNSDVEALDRYEGVEIDCYSKEYLPVTMEGDTKEMLVYISNRERFNGKLKSHDEYMNKVIDAAEFHGLDKEYISSLRAFIS